MLMDNGLYTGEIETGLLLLIKQVEIALVDQTGGANGVEGYEDGVKGRTCV